MRPALILLTTLLSFSHGAPRATAEPQSGGASRSPNVLIVLADDLGFSDLSSYGSEIKTPNLDRLAMGGLRFRQFYNTAKCHSSLISLLSGRYPFQAGNRSFGKSVTLPEVVAGAGYFTAMTGKWHQKQQPTVFGFQRYFGHLEGTGAGKAKKKAAKAAAEDQSRTKP